MYKEVTKQESIHPSHNNNRKKKPGLIC